MFTAQSQESMLGAQSQFWKTLINVCSQKSMFYSQESMFGVQGQGQCLEPKVHVWSPKSMFGAQSQPLEQKANVLIIPGLGDIRLYLLQLKLFSTRIPCACYLTLKSP
jgi:hypothetical protein